MKALTIPYPETVLAALNISSKAFEKEARIALAMKFFEMGKLSSGQAAELAGISRIRFLFKCEEYGVPSVSWDEDEIQAEFEQQKP